MLTTWMEKKGMTMYRLSKAAGVPYSTVNDLCSGKTRLEKYWMFPWKNCLPLVFYIVAALRILKVRSVTE